VTIFFAAVLNNMQKTTDRLSVPITKAEFAVMRTALSVSCNLSKLYETLKSLFMPLSN